MIESSSNPSTEEISAADVEPITETPGKASRTAVTIVGSKLSNAENMIPAWGVPPARAVRHCSMAVAIASPGSTSSL